MTGYLLKSLVFGGVISIVAWSTALANEVSIPFQIKVKQFNSIASNYLDAPTFVAINDKSKYDQLILKVDLIEKSKITRETGALYEVLAFSEKESRFDNAIKAIDKYLKWHDIASADKDIFTKRIDWVKYNSGSHNEFIFHSGNAENHYLKIKKHNLANSLNFDVTKSPNQQSQPPEFVFDKENAILLRKLLVDWRDGKFEDRLNLDLDDKYK